MGTTKRMLIYRLNLTRHFNRRLLHYTPKAIISVKQSTVLQHPNFGVVITLHLIVDSQVAEKILHQTSGTFHLFNKNNQNWDIKETSRTYLYTVSNISVHGLALRSYKTFLGIGMTTLGPCTCMAMCWVTKAQEQLIIKLGIWAYCMDSVEQYEKNPGRYCQTRRSYSTNVYTIWWEPSLVILEYKHGLLCLMISVCH